jgi:hypothetical protein
MKALSRYILSVQVNKLIALIALLLMSLGGYGQCVITATSPITTCSSGLKTLHATSNSSTVHHHRWFDRFGNQIAPTRENAISYGGDGVQNAWVSELDVLVTENTTYSVAADCNYDQRETVDITVNQGDPIGIDMNPAHDPSDLCAGQTITLLAHGAVSYSWTRNGEFANTNPPYNASIQATQSGVYTVTATNNCNNRVSSSITLVFRPALQDFSIVGPREVIEHNPINLSATTSGASGYSWSIDGGHSINWSNSGPDYEKSSSATVTSDFIGTATVSVTAVGCFGTSKTSTKSIEVKSAPTSADCAISFASDITGCSGGHYMLSATSTSPYVTDHKWYLFETGEGAIEPTNKYSPSVGTFVSQFEGNFSSDQIYWVEPICSGSTPMPRTKVQFRLNNSSSLRLDYSPSEIHTQDLCEGDEVTLTASLGLDYEWRLDDPNKATPDYYGDKIKPTISGTYYVSSAPSCGTSRVSQSIALNFKPRLANLSIVGPGSTCLKETPIPFSIAGEGNQSQTWSVSDDDPNANSSIDAFGNVKLNGVVGTVTVSVSVGGCNGSSATLTPKTVQVQPPPTLQQCSISRVSDLTACAGTNTLSAQSTSDYVKGHKWYDSQNGSNQITISRQYQGNGGAWISEVDINLNQSITYWVEPQCDCEFAGARVPVSFTLDHGSVVGMDPLKTNDPSHPVVPSDLCIGDQVLLGGNNAAAYEWRFGNPNKATPDFQSQQISPNQSGTYYLRGSNTCGIWMDGGSVTLNFQPKLSAIGIIGPDPVCQNTVATTYAASPSSSNYTALKWFIADNDTEADATVDINTGVVQWKSIKGSATISMTAYGCNSTTEIVTKPVQVTPTPYNLTLVTDQPNFCKGTQGSTQFIAQGASTESFSWAVSGGNQISTDGKVTWADNFSSEATITATAHGCNGSTKDVSAKITVYPLAVVTTTPSGSGIIEFRKDALLATTTALPNVTYQWLKSGIPIAQATGTTYNIRGPGIFSVRTTNEFGCTFESNGIAVTAESNYNYIIENLLQTDKLDNGTTINPSDLLTLTADQSIQTLQYFDGLGRPMQSVVRQGSPSRQDIVQPVVYDPLGREIVKFLPFTVQQNGFFKENVVNPNTKAYTNSASGFYSFPGAPKVAQDTKPFAETVYEPSPLSRVLKQGAPGETWQPGGVNDHTVKKRYEVNGVQEVVLFHYDSNTGEVVVNNDPDGLYYAAGELTKTVTVDEHNREIIEYVDKQGKAVCKKVQHDEVNGVKKFAFTYYVYDDLGNLSIVLPPEASKSFHNQTN